MIVGPWEAVLLVQVCGVAVILKVKFFEKKTLGKHGSVMTMRSCH